MQTFQQFINESKISLPRELARYVYKIGPPQLTKSMKIWRGVSERSGSNGARYGLGLYTTTSQKHAKEFGTPIEMDRYDHLPSNALIFKKDWDWEMFDQTLIYDILKSTRRDVIDGFDVLVRKHISPDIDGVQIGLGAGAFFVRWP